MKHRKLRIAISAVCGIICLLLVALWVRSYWRYDMAWWIESKDIVWSFSSNKGLLHVERGSVKSKASARWGFVTHYRTYDYHPYFGSFHYEFAGDKYVLFPHWLPLLVGTSLALSPWLRWRFSLRTLLIAITLVAVVLGLAIYAIRN
jgi:hypothetical protein